MNWQLFDAFGIFLSEYMTFNSLLSATDGFCSGFTANLAVADSGNSRTYHCGSVMVTDHIRESCVAISNSFRLPSDNHVIDTCLRLSRCVLQGSYCYESTEILRL
jgi:hypothetical protein